MYEAISDAILRELDILEDKYSDGKIQMSGQDLEHIDTMAHAMKCLATYDAMIKGSRTNRRYRESYYTPSESEGYTRRY